MSRTVLKFRPTTGDALEERLVLSHTIPPMHAPIEHVHPLSVRVQARRPALTTIATLGDSYTDEYRYYPPDRSHARNWVEILGANKRANFGPVVQRASDPASRGYAYNFARSGATTTVVVQTELPRLLPLVSAGKVSYVTVFAGGNDFLYMLQDVLTGAVPAGSAASKPAEVAATAEANIRQTVTTLLAANPSVRIALATVADVNTLPIVQTLGGSPQFQSVRAATSAAIQEYNAAIQNLVAGTNRVALVDLATMTNQLAHVPASVPYGGTTISTTTAGDDFHDFFLADGIHVGTVGQGMIANAFVTTIDTAFGAQLRSLTAAQIVRFARSVQVAAQHGGGPI